MPPAISSSESGGLTSNPNASRLYLGLPWRAHAFAWGGLLVLVLVLLGLSSNLAGKSVWDGWIESRGLRRPSYAERIYFEHLFRTRANTWSNLAFVVVGFYALALGYLDLRRRRDPSDGYVIATPAMSFLFGTACCFLGFGSGIFHASLTRWGQHLDVATMYPPLLAGIAMSFGRWQRQWDRSATPRAIPIWVLLGSMVVATSCLLYHYKWSMSAGTVLRTLILTQAGGALVDLLLARHALSFRWLLCSTLALATAVICRQLDVAGKFSGPDSWFQGHAVWHVLTALSLACVYAYHRSETLEPEPKTSAAAPRPTATKPAQS